MKARKRKLADLSSDSRGLRCSRRGQSWSRRAFTGISAGIILLALFSPVRATNNDNSEYRLKLAFLYNFAQFVQWPTEAFPDSGAPLTICIAGNNPFEGDIEQSLSGRTVGGHPVELRRLDPHEDPHFCQMIFVRASETKAAAKILAHSRGSSTLTVGEAVGFAARGGIINLTLEENRLRFEVNIDAAAQTRLRISSKLLSLAKIVRD